MYDTVYLLIHSVDFLSVFMVGKYAVRPMDGYQPTQFPYTQGDGPARLR